MKGKVFFIIGLLLGSCVVATGLTSGEHTQTCSLSLSFSEPSLIEDESYVNVIMQGAAACLYHPGKPVLPMYTTTLQLPFGSIIRNVTIHFDEVKTMKLQKKITPAPYPLIEGISNEPSEVTLNSGVYCTKEFYPLQWVAYSTGGGLNNDSEHVTFFSLRVFPLRYNPGTDTVNYLDACQIIITYILPTGSPFPTEVTNNLVIISPLQFVPPLERLAEHKNNIGIRTQIITLGAIYRDYPGNDRPEQIKYFIKNAVEKWGTTYVLLVGGLKSHIAGKPRDNINTGTRDWYLPVRYTNLWDTDSIYDPGFISDLYYADIYDSEGSFCNWDSCGDGVYGGWTNPAPIGPPSYSTDQIDFYPDVYLGRLPCRNIIEVNNIVNKIIAYEQKPADLSWFKKMVVVGGDPYDDQGTNYLEGELIGEKALSYMYGFEQQKLFSSNRETNPDFTPKAQNIIREINEGCGFLFLDGHGGPSWWNTYWPGEFDTLIQNGGIRIYQFSQLKNSEKLPVCIIGGCHNNQFNVSVLLTIADFKNRHFMWSNGVPVPECWGWSLTAKPTGGAIATIGNTALGYEAGGEVGDLNGDNLNEPDCVEALCGYLETQFFKGYGVHHIDILGKNWCNAIGEYLNIYPGMENRSNAKTIEQWVLFGDPSLKIGGYPL
jgi:hypothetical protein